MKIYGIAATDDNLGIGFNDSLPWGFIKNDMDFFREITIGNPIIMGSNAINWLKGKPLPNRHNIVVSSQRRDVPDGFILCSCRNEVLDVASSLSVNGLAFVIGGAKTYKSFIDDMDGFYLSRVKGSYEANVFLEESLLDRFSKCFVIDDCIDVLFTIYEK